MTRKSSANYQFAQLHQARTELVPRIRNLLGPGDLVDQFDKALAVIEDHKSFMAAPEEKVRWVHDTLAMVLPYMAPGSGGETEDERLSRLVLKHGANLERETTLQDLVEEHLLDLPGLDANTARIVRAIVNGAINALGFLDFSTYERKYQGEMQRGADAFCSELHTNSPTLKSALEVLKAMPVKSDEPHGGVGCADMFDFLRYKFLHCAEEVRSDLSPCARDIADNTIALQLLNQSSADSELGLKQAASVLNSDSQKVKTALQELFSVFPPPTQHLNTRPRATHVSKPTLAISENGGRLSVSFTSTFSLSPTFIPLPPEMSTSGSKEMRRTHELMSEACRIMVPRFMVREHTRELIRQAVETLMKEWSVRDLGCLCMTFRRVADEATRIAQEQGERNRKIRFQTVQAMTAHWDVRLPSGDIHSFRKMFFSQAGKQVHDRRGFNVRQSAYEEAVLSCIGRDPGASAREVAEELQKEGLVVSLRKVNKDILSLMDKLVQKHRATRPTATVAELEACLERRGFRITPSRRERIAAAMPKAE